MSRPTIADRVASEKQYHESFYDLASTSLDVNFALATSAERRPHNLIWSYYDTLLAQFSGNLVGKRVLVPGCGVGEVALNLAKNGALVDGFDVCEKAVTICRERASHHGIENAHFFVSSCEELDLPSRDYDAVAGEMILHHIDIPAAMEKFYQSLKTGGVGVFAEWKNYLIIDSIRSTSAFRRIFPPGGVEGYATEFEHKLTRSDFRIIKERFPSVRLEYRYCIRGKLDYFFSPSVARRVEKLDYYLLKLFPVLRPFFTDGIIICFRKE